MERLRRASPLLVLGLWALAGCATYSDQLEKVRASTRVGNYAEGVEVLDELLDVKDPGALPDGYGGDNGLLVLERATLQQALSAWDLSQRDFQVADKELEMLDISGDIAGTLAKYLFSDSATRYKSSPTEKISLNSLNMANYLAAGDPSGARVEAKRFTVMREYLTAFDARAPHGVFGSYLAGFVFEQLGEYQSAMRYYDEAIGGRDFQSLVEPVARLSQLTTYRGKHIGDFLKKHPTGGLGNPGAQPAQLLVLVSIGRVPHKEPKRIPAGAAVAIVGSAVSGSSKWLKYGATKVVVYPELVQSVSGLRGVRLHVDGHPAEVELATDLATAITREYEAIKPQIMIAALTRMATRAAVAEGARAAGEQQSSGLGTFTALATESIMVARDKPDTRSWESLPRWLYVHRQRVSPGPHELSLSLEGPASESLQYDVVVPPGGYAAVVVTAPR